MGRGTVPAIFVLFFSSGSLFLSAGHWGAGREEEQMLLSLSGSTTTIFYWPLLLLLLIPPPLAMPPLWQEPKHICSPHGRYVWVFWKAPWNYSLLWRGRHNSNSRSLSSFCSSMTHPQSLSFLSLSPSPIQASYFWLLLCNRPSSWTDYQPSSSGTVTYRNVPAN